MTGQTHRRRERGSVLMLMPAAIVIVLLLGAIAVDAAIVYLGQRQAFNVAFDAANDAAGTGFDGADARNDGTITYDVARVRAIASTVVDGAGITELRLHSVTVGDGVVTVTVEYRVDHLFGPAFGGPGGTTRQIAASADGAISVLPE